MAYIPSSGSVVAFQQFPSSLQAGVSVIGLTPVNVSNTNLNVGGSVVAFQGGAPWPVAPNNSSVIAFQLAGSVLATSATVNAGNSSVMLLNSANVIGSVTALQGTNPWLVNAGGSIAAVIIGGSVATATTNSSVMLLNSSAVIGSVTALQGTNPWLQTFSNSSIIAYQAAGSILAVAATVNTGNSSVMLLNGANTIGSVTALQGSNPWIMTGSVQGTVSVLGTVPVTQSTTPWVVNFQNSSIIATQLAGSILATSATVTMTNSSVMLLNGANVIGSVTALQGTSPWLTTVGGSVAAVIIGGSVATATTNSSVMLLNSAAVIGSVTALQGTNPWIQTFSNSSIIALQVAGSIMATSATVTMTNSSVMLLNGANVIGSVTALQGTNPWIVNVGASIAAVIIGGSVATATTNSSVMLLNSAAVIGSVTALQGTNPWITNIGGSVAAVIIGGSVATATTNSSVMLLNGANVIGSVTALQGTNPWIQTFSNSSIIAVSTGSLVAIPTGNQSVSGTVSATLIANTIPATSSILVGVTANTNGSVVTTTGYPQTIVQITSGPGASITAAINFEGTVDGTQFVPIQGYNLTTQAISSMATVESDWAFNTTGLQGMRARVSNWTVGSITARAVVSPSDARPFATYNSGGFSSVSGTLGASIIGQLPAGVQVIGSVAALQGTSPWLISSVYGNISGSVVSTQGTTPWIIGSVYGNISGSVVSTQGTSPWVVNFQNSSILAVPVGSTFSLAEVARNDTLNSILGADLTYRPQTGDSAGRTIIKPFVADDSAAFRFQTSVVSGSVTLIQASSIGKRSYITDFWLVNSGSVATLITFQGGDTSIVGFAVAPAGTGANSNGINIPLRTNPSQDLAFKMAPSASILYLTVTGYQAQ